MAFARRSSCSVINHSKIAPLPLAILLLLFVPKRWIVPSGCSTVQESPGVATWVIRKKLSRRVAYRPPPRGMSTSPSSSKVSSASTYVGVPHLSDREIDGTDSDQREPTHESSGPELE